MSMLCLTKALQPSPLHAQSAVQHSILMPDVTIHCSKQAYEPMA